MIRICNWYHEPKVLGEKEPFEDKSETHTICPECYEKFKTALKLKKDQE